MVEHSAITLLRSVLEGLCTMIMFMIIFIVCNGYRTLGIASCAKLSVSLICIYLFFKYIATRRRNTDSVEDCNKYYGRVATLSRKQVGYLLVLQLIFYLLVFTVNFAPNVKYPAVYPNATQVLKENYTASDTTIVLIQSVPYWWGGRILANAESYKHSSDAMSSEELTDAQKKQVINDDAKYVSRVYARLNIRAVIGFTLCIFLGFVHYILHARLAYIATLSSLNRISI